MGPGRAAGGLREPRGNTGAKKAKPLEMSQHPKMPHWKRYLLLPLEAQALQFDFSSPACHGEAGMNFMVGEFSGFNN